MSFYLAFEQEILCRVIKVFFMIGLYYILIGSKEACDVVHVHVS